MLGACFCRVIFISLLLVELIATWVNALAGAYATHGNSGSSETVIGTWAAFGGLLGLLLPLVAHGIGLVMPLVALPSFERHHVTLHKVSAVAQHSATTQVVPHPNPCCPPWTH